VQNRHGIIKDDAIKLNKDFENSKPELDEAELIWKAAQKAYQDKGDLASIAQVNAFDAWIQYTPLLIELMLQKNNCTNTVKR